MKRFIKKILFSSGLVFACGFLSAQSLDQAKKLYNEGQYEEAKPAFERLVKQAPNNGSYNHWYGVCCYETGDLEGAEKYLKVGVKRKVQDSYRYLAEVYYETYRFEEAADLFDDYIDMLAKKKQDVEPFQIKMDKANTAQRMLEKVEDVQVIDSVIVDKKQFLDAYVLSEEGGSLIPYDEFFQSAKRDVLSVVYRNQKGDKVYYARETNDNKLCLFTQSRLIDQWGDEKQLPMNINSSDDDNFPFVLSDGVTLYYASKGNNSLGGYDLFVTRYNTNTDSYLTPEQLGMPYNSPYNDYMIVFDEAKKLGWFASDRYQPEDKICLYLFIPNETRARIDSEDIEQKRARASLRSIASTWKDSSNYPNLVRLAYEEIPYGKVEVKKDFEFIINNSLVYYTLEEIKSPEARNFYEKVVGLNRQIDDQKKKLDSQRVEFTRGNSSRREQLRPSILQAEEQLENLMSQTGNLEKRARNAEITYLRNTNKR